MKEAIKKILTQFVFDGDESIEYEIHRLITPEENKKRYEIEIYLDPNDSEGYYEALSDKIENALKLLGFSNVYGSMYNAVDINKLLIRAGGLIEE